MGLDGADSFDKRSLSSVHSHLSLHTMRNVAALVAEQKRATAGGDDGMYLSSPSEDYSPRV